MSKNDQEELLHSVAPHDASSMLNERLKVERELFEERERLRITLASIGDGVITTDADGRVTFLNAVAESLTGYTMADAAGRHLREIFRIVNEESHEPVENPVMRALQEGRIVGLANHTILFSRDGSVRPIDDSAAPMRNSEGAIVGAVLVFRDITERKRAEETRARLAAIVESSEDAVVSKTLEGEILTWNEGATRIFGYTAEEIIGKPITLVIPPELIEEEREILESVRQGKRIEHFETVRLRKDGRRLNISVTVSPIRDHEGRIIGASKIGRDITSRVRDEEALKASEERHRFLAELAAATQPSTNPGEVMAVTARMLVEHLGVERCIYAEAEDDATFIITADFTKGGSTVLGRWPLVSFGREFHRAMLANEPFVIDDVDFDPRIGPDLTAYRRLNIQSAICVPLHKAGELTAAMTVHQSTPRKWTKAEMELVRTVVDRSWESIERTRVARGLQETAERLALALAAASLGDWSWDAVTDVLTLSPRAAEIFGIPAGTLMTSSEVRQLLIEEDRERARISMEQAIADHEQYNVEYRVRRNDGREVWVSAKGRAQYDSTGQALGMFGVIQDITERKQLEIELQRRADELAAADRKKDDFIALLAHELRNPLAPIRTGLQVMRLSTDDPQTMAEVQAMMDRQLTHMVRLIDDLLDVSRIDRNKLQLQKKPVLLSEVVHHAVEIARPVVEVKGHQLDVQLPSKEAYLDADLTRLAQVFGNLLTNSAKYTERGGQLSLNAKLKKGEVVVSVKDNGIGIPPDALSHIFDMFTQVERSLERSEGGLGIGLTLVKRLVEMHGGAVEAKSDGPGRGSEFIVRLPTIKAATRGSDVNTAEGTAPRTTGRRILVVDDNLDAASSLETLLRLMGHDVHTAHDGLEAVGAAAEFKPDVVLLDIGLPKLNGYEAARRIRDSANHAGMTLVAVTGWGQEDDRRRSKEAGFDWHMTKPIEIAALQKLLDATQPSPGK